MRAHKLDIELINPGCLYPTPYLEFSMLSPPRTRPVRLSSQPKWRAAYFNLIMGDIYLSPISGHRYIDLEL